MNTYFWDKLRQFTPPPLATIYKPITNITTWNMSKVKDLKHNNKVKNKIII